MKLYKLLLWSYDYSYCNYFRTYSKLIIIFFTQSLFIIFIVCIHNHILTANLDNDL